MVQPFQSYAEAQRHEQSCQQGTTKVTSEVKTANKVTAIAVNATPAARVLAGIFLENIEIVGHSVLGTQLVDGSMVNVAGLPEEDEALVDPAGLKYISGIPPTRISTAPHSP